MMWIYFGPVGSLRYKVVNQATSIKATSTSIKAASTSIKTASIDRGSPKTEMALPVCCIIISGLQNKQRKANGDSQGVFVLASPQNEHSGMLK